MLKDEVNIGLRLKLYEKMLLIRNTEISIQNHYSENDMKTPMHMSMGEEPIVVGICEAAGKDLQVFGSYRSHALYLAKTGEVNNFFLEMFGKENKIANGKAGSMHISSVEDGHIMSSAIVASHIPVATGAAYANLIKKNNVPVAVFFGDGAIDEGVFWESLNLACLMKLPMIFVCEDNGLAVHTPASKRHGYNSISKVVSQFNCVVYDMETTDVEIIYDYTQMGMVHLSHNNGPVFMRVKYHRYLEHVGVKEDYEDGYRSRSEYERCLCEDPVKMQKQKLLSDGFSEAQLTEIENKMIVTIEKAIDNAKQSPCASPDCLFEGVFNEGN